MATPQKVRAQEVKIPDIGDAEDVEVIEIVVAPGDVVAVDDLLIVIESDKASMEIPSPSAGTIAAINVAVGDPVVEGQVIVTLDVEGVEGVGGVGGIGGIEGVETATAEDGPVVPSAEEKPTDADVPPAPVADSPDEPQRIEVRVPDVGESQEVVVIELAVAPGDTVDTDDLLLVVESDKASMEIVAPAAGTVTEVAVALDAPVEEDQLLVVLRGNLQGEVARPAPEPAVDPQPKQANAPVAPMQAAAQPAAAKSEPAAAAITSSASVYAGPAVRRLARELGVQLADVTGTGSRGRVVKDDVKAFVKDRLTRVSGGSGIPAVPEIDFAKFGPVELKPLTRIRQRGAANLHRSWLNVPHVTQFDEADITELEEFRASLKADAEREGVRLTPLSFIVKACCHALREFPTFNASLDADAKNFILKHYYHVGFAVDTPEGLVVPVIRDADKLGIWELSAKIAELSEKARTQKLGIDELQGGTFTVSSLGAIGGTGFTPVVNAPEVAILGVARLATKPVWDGDAFVPRKMLPLALSYDHKAVNGAEGGRFMVYLRDLLEDVRRLAL